MTICVSIACIFLYCYSYWAIKYYGADKKPKNSDETYLNTSFNFRIYLNNFRQHLISKTKVVLKMSVFVYGKYFI